MNIPENIREEIVEIISDLKKGARLSVSTSKYSGYDASKEASNFMVGLILEGIGDGKQA
jgi:hypothetical protein